MTIIAIIAILATCVGLPAIVFSFINKNKKDKQDHEIKKLQMQKEILELEIQKKLLDEDDKKWDNL